MKLRLLSCLIGVGLLSTSAVAQQLTGTMSGTVKDSQGAVVPGVTVTATSDALIGGPRTVVTSETGTYQFTTLPPGTFQLTFGLSGFVTLKREGVAIQVVQNTRVDAELQVGSLEESLTVTGSSPVVDVLSTTTQTQHPERHVRSHPHEPESVGHGRFGGGRGDRASRCRRYAGDAAVCHRSVRLGGQSEDVFR